jgi:glyoxylase-like metal-dependent hydrolase (beta-lactamase superfamily II)
MTMRFARTFASLLLAAALPAAAQDFSKVEIKTTKLADHVYMLTGAGGNLGLSTGEDATFLIDDQFAPLTERISAAIAKITREPVRFVLNTHWHFDHTGGNENFGRMGTLIFAHENVRKRMSTEQFIAFLDSKQPASPKAALPVVTFSENLAFHLNGEEIRVMHVPRAHTDGDAIVHFTASDVLHMGDVFFNGAYPFIDTSSGGTIDGVVAACDRALGIAGAKTRIIPGPGALSDRRELQEYRDMLADVAGRLHKLVAEGRTVGEIVAAKVTAPYDGKFGKGFIDADKFSEMVATQLGAGK